MAWLLTWLVQGLAIAVVTRVALRALPGLSAATRYAMWWAALVLVLILPIVRGLTIDALASVAANASADAGPGATASAPSTSSPSQGDFEPADEATRGPVLSFSLPAIPLPRVPDWFLSIVIGLWLGAAMLGLARVAYSVQTVRRLKASCRRMSVPREADLPMWSAVRDRGRAVRVRASDRVRTAAVLGLTRPVIAVPRDASMALTAHEIDQIVLHEYAHVQRYDDWTKLLQVLISAFAGWHPAVRLMMREIDFEREAACDDYVVDVTGAPRAYARCLTKVIEMMPRSPSPLDFAAVPHAFGSASQATTRIERLLDRKRPPGRFAVMPAMAGSVMLAVLGFCTVHALPIATDLPRTDAPLSLSRDGATLASATTALPVDSRDDATAIARNAVVAAADVTGRDARAQSAPDRGGLRIAAASMLPIDLPFSRRFSPLSRLTSTQPAPARPAATAAANAPTSGSRLERNANTPAAPAPAATAAVDTRQAREPFAENGTNTAPTPGTATAAAAHRYEGDSRSAVNGRRPAATPDMRDAAAPRAEATFALGPVVAAGDSDSMPEADDAGNIERAWENTRDATSKAMGASARAVGSATKTAGDATTSATKTATSKAAAGVKAGGAHTARAFGRVKRTLASVF